MVGNKFDALLPVAESREDEGDGLDPPVEELELEDETRQVGFLVLARSACFEVGQSLID
jgi:hypothetical protein